MKNFIIAFASLALLGAAACGGDDTVTVDSGKPDSNSLPDTSPPGDSGADSGISKPPTLGAQIDRIGRPAANTAANNVFNPDATSAGKAKDAYNAAADPTAWQLAFTGEIGKNLAVFDGLDGKCSNQALAKATVAPGQHDVLGGALADDRLYINTANAVCTTYLAVELDATGLAKNKDCGGRALPYDVIDATYTVVSGATSPVTDGISADATKTGGKTFPYLAPAK